MSLCLQETITWAQVLSDIFPFLFPCPISLVHAHVPHSYGCYHNTQLQTPEQLSRGDPASNPAPSLAVLCFVLVLPPYSTAFLSSFMLKGLCCVSTVYLMSQIPHPNVSNPYNLGPIYPSSLIFYYFSMDNLCLTLCPVHGLDHAVPSALYALSSLSVRSNLPILPGPNSTASHSM